MWTCPKCGREFKRKNQSHYCGEAPKTIDEYILKQDEDVKSVLFKLREIISAAIPDADETIVWSMPTWRKNGNIIHFAMNKNHIGLYIGERAVKIFGKELEKYEVKKGTWRLDPHEALPSNLIEVISKYLYKIDEEI